MCSVRLKLVLHMVNTCFDAETTENAKDKKKSWKQQIIIRYNVHLFVKKSLQYLIKCTGLLGCLSLLHMVLISLQLNCLPVVFVHRVVGQLDKAFTNKLKVLMSPPNVAASHILLPCLYTGKGQ